MIENNLSPKEWCILQNSYDPCENLKYESLFGMANGYMGTRGAYEETTQVSLPATYVHGVFDRSEAFMRELVNIPNYLGLKLYCEKVLLGVETCTVIAFTRTLDLKQSILVKSLTLRDCYGRETLIEGIRFLSRANRHRTGIRLYVTPLNYEGILEVENIVDGTVTNFCDAPRFKVKHTVLTQNDSMGGRGAYIEVKTRDRGLPIGVGSCIRIHDAKGEPVISSKHFNRFGEQAIEFNDFKATQGQTYMITKYCAVYTGRDVESKSIKSSVQNEILNFIDNTFEKEMAESVALYEKMWEMADIKIVGDDDLNQAIRFNIYHLMSTASEHDDTVNIGAKLLHGEEYGGHAFWDTEIFMLPFFSYVFPSTARNLVSYRYHLLNAARKNASEHGYLGAKFPWESADDGMEQCPDWTIDPDGSCYPCYVSKYEHHVTSAVAFGIYNYCRVTGDTEFLHTKGLEILLETARFWVSRCTYNESHERFEILEVTGPDEWHEPVNNNVYTNFLAKWNIELAINLLEDLNTHYPKIHDDLTSRLCLYKNERIKWKEYASKLYLPFKEGTKLLEQFEGYFKLQDVTIEEYDENDWPKRPLALKTTRARHTQIIKQADIVMLMHLLGDAFDDETKALNYHYYEKRTLHGSSLSPSIYAIMGLKVGDTSKAYRYLRRAAFIDLLDLQGNTREGIHAANCGGVWQTIVLGFAGMNIDDLGHVSFKPQLPKQWEKLSFKLIVRNQLIEVTINQNNTVTITGDDAF